MGCTMTTSKFTASELHLKALELALVLADLLEQSAREGAARVCAMSDEEVERFLKDGESVEEPPRQVLNDPNVQNVHSDDGDKQRSAIKVHQEDERSGRLNTEGAHVSGSSRNLTVIQGGAQDPAAARPTPVWPSGVSSVRTFVGRRRAAASDGWQASSEPGEKSAPSDAPIECYVFEVAQGAFRILEKSGVFYVEFEESDAPTTLSLDQENFDLEFSSKWPGLFLVKGLRERTVQLFDFAYQKSPDRVHVRWN